MSKPVKYTQAFDGDWIRPVRKGYRTRCCDCGLVHVFDFKVIGRVLMFKVRRDKRATAKARKRLAHALHR